MLMFRSLSIALVLSFLGTLPLTAADSPISAFPKDTGVLLRLKSPQKTLQTAGALAVKVDRKEGVKVQLATPLLGTLISNPSLKGVDLNSDWWVGVFPNAEGDPGVVFAIPATDADAMKSAVMGDQTFQTFEKWVIYTDHAPSAGKIKTQLGNQGAGVSMLLNATGKAVWDEGDLSLFVNVPEILKIYQGPFDQGVQQVNGFIEQMPNLVPPQQSGVDMKTIADMYASAFKGLVQGVKDSQGWTCGLGVTDSQISISEYADFGEKSETAQAIAKHKPSALALLDQLPADKLGYGAVQMDTNSLVQWSLKMSLNAYAQGDTVKEKQVKDLVAEYEKLKFGSMAMSLGLGDLKEGVLRMSAVLDMKDPESVRKLAKKSGELMSNTTYNGMTMEMKYEPNAETFGNQKADVTRINYKFDPNNPAAQMQGEMIKAMYGPDGMATRAIYLKDRMVQTMGGTKADMQAALDAANGKNNIGGQEAFQAARKQLLDEANLIGLVDIPGVIANGFGLAIQAGQPVPLEAKTIEDIRGKPSFAGCALKVENHGLHAKTVIPLPQMQGIAKTVRALNEAQPPF